MNESLRGSWWAKHTEAKKWKRIVWLMVCGKKPVKPLQKAKVTIIRRSSVECDFDGLVSTGKHLLDGLVESGVLVNDKMSNIGQAVYKWEKVKPGYGSIGIIVEEVL